MSKFLSVLLLLFFISCNNKPTSKDAQNTTVSASNTTAHNWNKEDEKEFLNSCIEGAKPRMKEEAAYSYCKCVLGKVQQKYPTLDSSIVALQDTLKAAEFTKDCK
jgi:hypothetical protein